MKYVPYLRSPAVICAFLGAGSLASLGLAHVLTARAHWCATIATVAVFNALTIRQALARSAGGGASRTGWRLFAAGVTISLVGQALWLLASGPVAWVPRVGALLFCTTTASGLCLALGVWKWSWRSREGHGAQFFLGSLFFCLSILLLPWLEGIWSPLVEGQSPFRLLAFTMAPRCVLVGGVASFLLIEDPRRFRGPLGWLLLNSALLFLQTALGVHGLNRFAWGAPSPWLALTPLITGSLFLAAYTPQPVEAPEDGRPVSLYVTGLLLHAPFLLAAALLALPLAADLAFKRGKRRPAWVAGP